MAKAKKAEQEENLGNVEKFTPHLQSFGTA